ncbi:sugar ABC transporter substrate-binding protein [Mycolicibacterium helvum]|uniref:D-ribose ABC transporter substrate-binding protein n=1 Tax=Mycolicibacterium helvum TaxID=1534349 RepID=A0A7I7SYH4_9MYCO|nr:sugar ABC transporter substrate-binding protein [Mycolicibacterium helvum]BBY62067.1 D-ribose ABC transporter substrate-binding protein [Mycolicibacterium helvum]
MVHKLQKRSRGLALVAASVLVMSLNACAARDTATNADCAQTYAIGFSHPSGQAAFVKALKSKVEQAAQANGCVKVLLDNTQGESLENQRATLESWVAQKVNAIVVLPVDNASVESLRKRAQAQGTKWLTYAGLTEGADGSVGFDNDASGTMVANDAIAWAGHAYPGGGLTAAITTSPLVGFNGRFAIPNKLLPEAGIDVVSYQQCLDQACGLRIAEDTLREHPNLRVFIGLNDDAALGALRAFNNAGVDPQTVYIAGQDGNIDGLEAVKKGGAYRASAAILLADLAQSIIDTSIAAVTGNGVTNSESAVELATLRDPAQLDKLIAQYN